MNELTRDCSNGWLLEQRMEKKRCRRISVAVTMGVLVAIVAAALVGWYFTKEE